MRCGFLLSMDTAALSPITSQSPFARLSFSDEQETHSLSQEVLLEGYYSG